MFWRRRTYIHVLAVISGYTGSNPHLFTMALLSRAPGKYTLTVSNYVRV